MKFKSLITWLAFVGVVVPAASALATTNSLTYQGVTFETMSSGNTLTLSIYNALDGGTGNWTDVEYLSGFELKDIGTVSSATVTSTNTGVTWTNFDGGVTGSGVGCTGGDPSFDCFATSPAVALTNFMTWTIDFSGTGLDFSAPSLKVSFLDNQDDTKPNNDLLSQTIPPIPEPEIYAMMGVGLGLLGWIGRRKKLKESAAA